MLKFRAHTESGGCGGDAELEGRSDTSHATRGCWCEKCQIMFGGVIQFKAHKYLGTHL